jgi:citrate lyase synthetase
VISIMKKVLRVILPMKKIALRNTTIIVVSFATFPRLFQKMPLQVFW